MEKIKEINRNKPYVEGCNCYVCEAKRKKDEILKNCSCKNCAPELYGAFETAWDRIMRENGDPEEIHNTKIEDFAYKLYISDMEN